MPAHAVMRYKVPQQVGCQSISLDRHGMSRGLHHHVSFKSFGNWPNPPRLEKRRAVRVHLVVYPFVLLVETVAPGETEQSLDLRRDVDRPTLTAISVKQPYLLELMPRLHDRALLTVGRPANPKDLAQGPRGPMEEAVAEQPRQRVGFLHPTVVSRRIV